MEEKRKLQRRHLIYYLTVLDSDSQKPLGFLVDISPGGVMVMSETPLETGKTYRITILLQTDFADRDRLTYTAKCRWCRRSLNKNTYDIGFSLHDLTDDDVREIEMLIDDVGFNN